jgi:hypothetical protein
MRRVANWGNRQGQVKFPLTGRAPRLARCRRPSELVKTFRHGAYQFSNAKGMRRTIGRTSGERGRKYTLGRRDSKPSVGLVLKRSSTRGYTAEHPTDIKRLATSSSPRVERVQQVQRRCPWARAMIASPYIRQLRYGLPLCCIHGQSRGSLAQDRKRRAPLKKNQSPSVTIFALLAEIICTRPPRAAFSAAYGIP